MTTPPRLSFDFDDTLSRPAVRAFARELAAQGCELWIVTMRFESRERMVKHYKNEQRPWAGNDDLLLAARELDIPAERIVFTNWRWKSSFLAKRDVLLHVDDCKYTLGEIRRKCPQIRAVNCWNNSRWKKICRDELDRWKGRAPHG